MKKLTFALLAVAAFAANASSGEVCGASAELAVTVADASRNGMPWAKIHAIMQEVH